MSHEPEFVTTCGHERTDHDICIVSCGIGPEYQEGLHSTRLHCEVNAPETWRLFYRDYPAGCPPHSEQQYAFKAFAMQRAIDAGFRFVVWMDSTFQPIRSLAPLWEILEKQGWYVPKQGDAVLGEWCSDWFLKNVQASRDALMTVPLCYSGIVALDMASEIGHAIWKEWRRSQRRGYWNGPHRNNPELNEVREWGVKFEGPCSYDPRCKGHRHDEAALSWILHQRGLRPDSHGFLTIDNPEKGIIGHHIPLICPPKIYA